VNHSRTALSLCPPIGDRVRKVFCFFLCFAQLYPGSKWKLCYNKVFFFSLRAPLDEASSECCQNVLAHLFLKLPHPSKAPACAADDFSTPFLEPYPRCRLRRAQVLFSISPLEAVALRPTISLSTFVESIFRSFSSSHSSFEPYHEAGLFSDMFEAFLPRIVWRTFFRACSVPKPYPACE